MKFERSFDYPLVRSIITHPRIYRHAGDDAMPPAEQYEPSKDQRIWYVMATEGDELMGLFMFVPHGAVCWEVHTCLLPIAWGCSVEIARELVSWVFANMPCERIVTTVPEYNRLAYRLAVNAGMEEYGRNLKSYLKGGKLMDEFLLGISKGER